MRATIDAADTVEELALAAAAIRPAAVELFDAGVPVLRIGALLSVLVEAVVEKCIGWMEPFSGSTPTEGEFAWLFLGSLARREPLPVSDVDTALVWRAPSYDDRPEALREAADEVLTLVERCGLERCPDGANADNPLFNRPFDVWVAARPGTGRSTPTGPGSLLLSSMLADSRPITGLRLGRKLARKVRSTPGEPPLPAADAAGGAHPQAAGGLRQGLRGRVRRRAPGQLDLKKRGLAPVVAHRPLDRDLHRGADRVHPGAALRAGAEAGLLTADESRAAAARARGDVRAAVRRRGRGDPGRPAGRRRTSTRRALDTLTRRHLRESFKAIARVQERLEGEWISRLR